jgi:transcriptional regulator with XRE-family HTH domain/Zn-dependent peptidase ImmA (M78 family)
VIVNERQFAQAKVQAERFRAALMELAAGTPNAGDLHPLIQQAQVDSLRTELATLESDIAEYQRLRSGEVTRFDLTSLAQLPEALIRARIAAGLTQRELADRMGLKEQQIQRYEATRYEGAGYSRLVDVADAIGLQVRKQLELVASASPAAVLQRLRALGFDETFIRRRIAPDLDLNRRDVAEVAERVSAIFDWPAEAILSGATLDPAQLGGATARFKMPKGREGRSATIYTAYAHRLATLCARAMAARPRQAVPTDWKLFRQRLIEAYGAVDFRSVCAFAWDLGVVVLPLNDSGAFHGACWRIGGVNVVVLKQAHRYPARWLFDLLHELRHAAEHPEADEFEVVEGAETSDARRLSREEQLCSWFAGQVTLNGEAENLVKAALESARSDLPRLKGAIESVAQEHGVDVGALANYAAFRLSLQNTNWWGAAANLQDENYDPLAYAREVFFDRFAFEGLNDADLQLLTLALHDEATDG